MDFKYIYNQECNMDEVCDDGCLYEVEKIEDLFFYNY